MSDNPVVLAYRKGYRVDDTGQVISPKTGKPRSTSKRGSEKRGFYYSFTIKAGRISQPIRVHRLLAYQLYGDEIFKHECVRHLDGDSSNNTPSNISLGSHIDNSFDRTRADRLELGRRGAKVLKKLTPVQVLEIRKSAHTLETLSQKYGVSKSTIFLCTQPKNLY